MVCPQNKKFLEFNKQTIEFTEKEMILILQNITKELILKAPAKKLMRFNIDEYYNLLGRNLSVLINNAGIY